MNGPQRHRRDGEKERAHSDESPFTTALRCHPRGDGNRYHDDQLDEDCTIIGWKKQLGHESQLRGHPNNGDTLIHNPSTRSRVPVDMTPRQRTTGNPRFLTPTLWGKVRAYTTLAAINVGSIIATVSPTWSARHERRLGRLVGRLVNMRLEVDGLDRIDPAERYVVVPLHEGFADALALMHLPIDLRFIVRSELFDWPALGRCLIAGGHPEIEINPTLSGLRRFYADCSNVFSEDHSLVVFPQGSILGVEVGFHKGAFKLAQRLGRPILPVVIAGSHRVWEYPFTSTLRFGQPVAMTILDPIPPGEIDIVAFRALEQNMKRIALREMNAPVRRFVPDRDGWWDGYPFEIDPDFSELASDVSAHRSGIDPDRDQAGLRIPPKPPAITSTVPTPSTKNPIPADTV